jgi:hypothetical protein
LSETKFIEIEHKFVLTDAYLESEYARVVEGLQPLRTEKTSVRDVYYWLGGNKIYRHRFDADLQHLTCKSIGDHPERRTEINLLLSLNAGDQQDRVQAFLETFGIKWQGTLEKKIHVAYFDDVEVVYYEAWTAGRRARCVEVEATQGKESLERARAIMSRYEKAFGFTSDQRSNETLFEILLLPDMPSVIQAEFSKFKI